MFLELQKVLLENSIFSLQKMDLQKEHLHWMDWANILEKLW
jgi:hypothetical protein